ncbi:MAG: DinB family protein [Planctomycetota bacterium]|nr:DinB family protein [Planctomycetota bacterium]
MEPYTTAASILSPESVLAMRDSVLGQVDFARRYTLGLLENVPEEFWSVVPTGGSSHISWQVGHLAVSQYGLMLFRQRGRAEGDLELMPGWLRKRFGRGSVPPTDPSDIPSKAALLECLDKIHTASMAALPNFTAEQLMEPTEMPYAVHPIKLGALLFCPLHESIHSGQIGALRRMHGLAPVR